MPETSTPLPQAELVHQLPGRLRLRVPARRGDAAFFAEMAKRLGGLAGVGAVHANPRSASLLLEHEGGADALLRAIREHGFLEVVARVAQGKRSRAPMHGPATLWPLSGTAAALAGLGMLQAARGRVIGPASENFWMGFRVYAELGRPRLAALLLGLGLYRLARGGALGSAASLFYYAAQANRLAGQSGGQQEPISPSR